MPREPLNLVVAVAQNGVMGLNGKLPWNIPADLKFFRATTMGHAIIMGRKTFDEVGKPLPKRRNIVVTRQRDLILPGAEVVGTLDEAIALARSSDPEPMVIGGAEIIKLAMPKLTRIYLTEIHRDVIGDTYFPAFDRGEWTETARREDGDVAWLTLERK